MSGLRLHRRRTTAGRRGKAGRYIHSGAAASRSEWLNYVEAQPAYGVPALYYVEAIDRSGERILPDDLDRVASSWSDYRRRRR